MKYIIIAQITPKKMVQVHSTALSRKINKPMATVNQCDHGNFK